MKIVNAYNGKSGAELLTYVGNNDSIVNVDGTMLQLIPCTLPFANQAQISTNDEADFISIRNRFSSRAVLVRI